MIEQAIYFALGCIVTALAALAFAPLFWRRALRLTRARLQLQVPLSMQEILAERDQLRAEYAVEQLRAEQAMERVRESKTRDMAVIGRQRLAATALADEVASLRQLERSQEREIRQLLAEAAAASTETGALKVELHDAHAMLERWKAHADRMADARLAMRNEVEEKRGLIASLETRISGLETRLVDTQRGGETRERGLRGRLEAAMAQSARHETSGIALRRDLDEARLRIRAVEDELEAALADARDRQKHANLAQSLQNGKARGLDRAQFDIIDGLRAENDVLRNAVAELRRSEAAPRDGDSDGGLRASIHALGLAVARMSKSGRDGPEPTGGPDRDRQRTQPKPSPIDAA